MAGRFRVATAAGLVVLAACGEPATESQRASSQPTASAPDRSASQPATPARKRPPAPAPSIKILTPNVGSTVHGSTVKVSVKVTGFDVVNKQFHAPVAGEGHIHFYLDAGRLPSTHSYPSPVTYRSISGTTYAWTGVSPGRHTFAVQLVGNDHIPLRAAAKEQVTVTVQ